MVYEGSARSTNREKSWRPHRPEYCQSHLAAVLQRIFSFKSSVGARALNTRVAHALLTSPKRQRVHRLEFTCLRFGLVGCRWRRVRNPSVRRA